MGALIGDALGVGPHWYYDLAELRRDYGDWVNGYTDPKPHRYHAGLKAGQPSQAGIITTMLLRSVVENGGYVEQDFCRRLDEELFPLLDGTPINGPGGYTSQSIREAWRRRVEQKKSWQETGGHADTTEAAERALVLAARYTMTGGALFCRFRAGGAPGHQRRRSEPGPGDPHRSAGRSAGRLVGNPEALARRTGGFHSVDRAGKPTWRRGRHRPQSAIAHATYA